MTDRTQLIIPSLTPVWSSLDRITELLLRIGVGGFLIPHGVARVLTGGIDKTAQFIAKSGIEPAHVLTYYITSLEIIGGFLITIGLLTRPMAALVMGFMAVASVIHLQTFGYFWFSSGAEVPLFWGLMAFILLIKGGGPLSVDRWIGTEL